MQKLVKRVAFISSLWAAWGALGLCMNLWIESHQFKVLSACVFFAGVVGFVVLALVKVFIGIWRKEI